MDFSYNFPAVRGIQAGREYYVSMVPLKLLPRLFPADDEIVPPECRAQRRINESRIPEIKRYILDNRTSYVFSALSAAINGEHKFVPYADGDAGVLVVSMEAIFLINDGQHRKSAIEEALAEDPTLENETISVVFFNDEGLKQSQQMFTDLNKHAVKTSNSLSTLYDARDQVAVATKNVIDAVPFFKKYTDKERDILGKNSSKLFTLSTLYKANQKILQSTQCSKEDEQFLIQYWKILSDNIEEWQDVMNKQLAKKSLREDYIISLSITINAFGRLGRVFYKDRGYDMESYLCKLKSIDWMRSNPIWMGRTIRENGKVQTSDEAIILTCSAIKKSLGIPLSRDEENKESHTIK